MINRSEATVLAVGVQNEKWIYEYKDKLNIKIFWQSGATIDFEAGSIKSSRGERSGV